MAGKRELIEPTKGDKRYVRRAGNGRFNEVDDLNRSLSADRRRKAKTTASKGQGDKGDAASRPARKTTAKRKPGASSSSSSSKAASGKGKAGKRTASSSGRNQAGKRTVRAKKR